MVLSLYSMPAQVASTWQKGKCSPFAPPMPFICSIQWKVTQRHFLGWGTCLVFLGHKLLRMVRSISCYFTRLHTGLHRNPGEWEEKKSPAPPVLGEYWDGHTDKLSHMEMGRGTLCLMKEPWHLHWFFCGSLPPELNPLREMVGWEAIQWLLGILASLAKAPFPPFIPCVKHKCVEAKQV